MEPHLACDSGAGRIKEATRIPVTIGRAPYDLAGKAVVAVSIRRSRSDGYAYNLPIVSVESSDAEIVESRRESAMMAVVLHDVGIRRLERNRHHL
jgi:hypothetical protein